MSISKNIKKILIDENLTQTYLAKKLGTSQQNLNSKLKRDNFSNREMLEIREKVLDDYIKLYEVLEDNHLIKETLDKKYQGKLLSLRGGEQWKLWP